MKRVFLISIALILILSSSALAIVTENVDYAYCGYTGTNETGSTLLKGFYADQSTASARMIQRHNDFPNTTPGTELICNSTFADCGKWHGYELSGPALSKAEHFYFPIDGATCPDGHPPYGDFDQDDDGWPDDQDECPTDPAKHEEGACGCGVPDVDTDGDGLLDCVDPTPEKDNKHGKGIVATKAICDGVTVYYEIAYQDGTIERFGSQTQYNLIQNGVSNCSVGQIQKNTIPKNSWEWDYNENTMTEEEIIAEILDNNLGQSLGEEKTVADTGTTTEGQAGQESNDSGNLKTIADNTKDITSNQQTIANKADVSNQHLADISGKLDEMINKPSDAITEDQMQGALIGVFDDYIGTSTEAQGVESQISDLISQGQTAYQNAIDTFNNPTSSDMIPTEYQTKTDLGSEISTQLQSEQNQAKNISDVIAQTHVTYSSPECELIFPYHDRDIKLTMCQFAPQLQAWGNVIKFICLLHCLMVVFRRS